MMKWSGREQGEASEARVDAGTNDSKEQDLEIRDITWEKKNGGFKTSIYILTGRSNGKLKKK